jgi:hypothetical protein
MKVFLSHSTKDQQFVQALAAELEAEKIEPWLCEVDIELGANFVAKIEEGLREADLARAPGSAGAGRHLGKRRGSAGARSSGLVALHVAPACASVDFAGSFDGS